LDSWTMAGDNMRCKNDGRQCYADCHSWWVNCDEAGNTQVCQKQYCSNTGGVRLKLERDDVDSYGPETTYIENVGYCDRSQGESCDITFVVHNYAGQKYDPPYRGPKEWAGPSKAVVTLYNGDRVVKKVPINEDMVQSQNNCDWNNRGDGGECFWFLPIFTLDAETKQVTSGAAPERPPPPTGYCGCDDGEVTAAQANKKPRYRWRKPRKAGEKFRTSYRDTWYCWKRDASKSRTAERYCNRRGGNTCEKNEHCKWYPPGENPAYGRTA